MIKTARRMRQHQTWAERKLWRWLRNRRLGGYKFRRQVPIGSYVVDFFCVEAALAIELDGSGHRRSDKLQHDRERDEYLEKCGVLVLRFPNSLLRKNEEWVRQRIYRALKERCPKSLNPNPLVGGEGMG